MSCFSLKLSHVNLGQCLDRSQVDLQGRLDTVNPSPFIGVDLNLGPIVYILALTDVELIHTKIQNTYVLSNTNKIAFARCLTSAICWHQVSNIREPMFA